LLIADSFLSMKPSHPQLAVRLSLLLVAAMLLASCRGRSVRETLGLNIARTVTHIAAGQSTHLTAYEEYREASNSIWSVQAAPLSNTLRAPVPASWSVSDDRLASINTDGTLTALKPGRITVTSAWDKYTATTVIEVVRNLPLPTLPQISAPAGSACRPQSLDLSFDEDRTLRFHLSGEGCNELEVEAKAPEKPLPWRFETRAGELELTEARGPVVKGVVRRAGTEISFTVWSTGTGAYPISLAGRRVLLVGDSMAEGIAPFLQRRVEAAGGLWTSQPEQSSTIIWWQGSGKLRALIAQHRPDIIFIALGSNELFAQDAESRAPLIRTMVSEIGRREAYWVGPPSWKPGSRLVPVIEENFQAGHFYNSDTLDVPRGKDGKHPTLQGYERWVELIWKWYARAI
jgi:lysophospholipase L1-like esterase